MLPRDPLPSGPRVPVIASDREHAITIAKTRPWWTRCLNRDKPICEHGKFYFVLADEPVSGLEELARTARKLNENEED